MKRKAAILLFTLLVAMGLGALVAACGVRVSAQGQWDLLKCTDEEGNVIAYGNNVQGGTAENTLSVSCEVKQGRFSVRYEGDIYYGEFAEEAREDKIHLTITMDGGTQLQAVCYMGGSSGSEVQFMDIIYDGNTYTFRKIA